VWRRCRILHRDPVSRKRRKSQIWDSKIWSRVRRDSDPRKTALGRPSSVYKRQTRPLVREDAPQKQDRNCQIVIAKYLVMSPKWGSTPRLTDWLNDRQSQCDFDFDFTRVLRLQLEEQEFCVRWPPACEDVSPTAEERPLLEDVTKQRSEDHDWEHRSLCDSDLWSVITSCVWKCQIDPITNPNPVYSQSRDNIQIHNTNTVTVPFTKQKRTHHSFANDCTQHNRLRSTC
jgi:hypothetical protein